MKKKTIIIEIIIIILVILTIAVLGITKFINNIKEDSNNYKETTTNVKSDYEQLDDNITNYNNKRTTLNTELSSYYQETFDENYEDAIKSIKEYDDIITKIKTNIENIDKNCKNNNFNETEVNNICQTYKDTYEKIVNTYVNDIKKFNEIVNEYNMNNPEEEEDLERFLAPVEKDYVDYNGDGNYEGKEQNENQ